MTNNRKEYNGKQDIRAIIEAFSPVGQLSTAERYGNGHIHETYKITTVNNNTSNPLLNGEYILQMVNNRVFPDIALMHSNIEKVTNHICNKLKDNTSDDHPSECLTLIQTIRGNTWHCDSYGKVWRMFNYISDTVSYDTADSPATAYECGKALGSFLSLLSDLPCESLKETIPDFHNIKLRLNNLNNAISNDITGRVGGISEEIEKIISRSQEMEVIQRLGSKGEIPLRTTHNDTKINNILFGRDGKARCIIDLDTVMPGYIHYDFGDAIRTTATTAAEDEQNLSLIDIDMGLFEAYTSGFMQMMRETLTLKEKEWLHLSPLLLTYTMAVRFLTDYIEGDIYFKTENPEHNLLRTKAQLCLLEKMKRQSADIKKIIKFS